MPDWKLCEGELAGGKFPLERYLGGSEGKAVFLTRFASARAVIKLVPAGPERAPELLTDWNRAGMLSHPHLIRIFEAGTGSLAGTPVAYLVMEYAAENLADVIRERPLTTDETREMVQLVADALAYLHGRGLVHANLKPSNILAVGDTVKISSEAVSAGDPAADIRALGITLVQALSRPTVQGRLDSAPDALPLPFRELAHNCLNHDPGLRWTAARIAAWLRSSGQVVSKFPAAPLVAEPARTPRSPYRVVTLVIVGLMIAAIVGALVMHRTATPVPSVANTVRPEPAPSLAVPLPVPQTAAPKAATPVQPEHQAEPTPAMPAAQDGITRRVIPDIPLKARNTVHGKVRVIVKVSVDPSGHVTEATLEPGGSPYFGRLALEAARHWEFAGGEVPQNWILRFEITRTTTQAIARRGPP